MKLNNIKSNQFVRAASMLAGGAALSQLIAVVTLPFIARLYEPASFGFLASYIAVLSISAISICLRFDVAVPLPKNKEDGAALVVVSSFFSAILSFLLFVIFLFFSDRILPYLGLESLESYLWIFFPSVFLFGIYSALQYWHVREKNFGLIARARVVQVVVGVSIQILWGLNYLTDFGLIAGQSVCLFGSVFVLLYFF